ncbi:protein-tyrosine-phosphatase [Rhodohalobacter sp. SW132]|uniref:protein-tyrosine-phosphatase n=1 Tax=Rhodohalobacter sp. SW132 TaxID=2293433 RepID=UPI000E282BEB|nr:protein-tyrosine-phosphatase [Rhodohalobacter sp. SW132]REL24539.1 protein-tyrosine-phosphatase [Rhodohalobacter sp. SW132]
MNRELQIFIQEIETEISQIAEERKKVLDEISGYVREKVRKDEPAKLTFICTHNSRRSTMGQIWAASMAHHYGLKRVETFSGGTETTAFNPRAVAAVERAGFTVKNNDGKNPHYRVYFSEDAEPLECFSKTYDDPFNPQKEFAAVMTCSDADQNCPFIPGAEKRISVPYRDPKESDGTGKEKEIYDERCRQIATEMAYVMNRV